MTEMSDDTTPTTEPATSAPASRRRMLFAALVAAALLAVAIAVVAVARGDGDQTQTRAAQVVAARQACEQWLDTMSPGAGPGTDWCDAMAGRMSDNIAGGRMMGRTMWDSPQAMRDVCVRAMEGREVAGSPARWCDQMVGWMSQQTGDWDNWQDRRR